MEGVPIQYCSLRLFHSPRAQPNRSPRCCPATLCFSRQEGRPASATAARGHGGQGRPAPAWICRRRYSGPKVWVEPSTHGPHCPPVTHTVSRFDTRRQVALGTDTPKDKGHTARPLNLRPGSPRMPCPEQTSHPVLSPGPMLPAGTLPWMRSRGAATPRAWHGSSGGPARLCPVLRRQQRALCGTRDAATPSREEPPVPTPYPQESRARGAQHSQAREVALAGSAGGRRCWSASGASGSGGPVGVW